MIFAPCICLVFNSKKITPVISVLEIKSVKYLALLCLRCWFDSPLLFARSKSEDINGITTDRRSDEKPQL